MELQRPHLGYNGRILAQLHCCRAAYAITLEPMMILTAAAKSSKARLAMCLASLFEVR